MDETTKTNPYMVAFNTIVAGLSMTALTVVTVRATNRYMDWILDEESNPRRNKK